jgi:hypothetical protein
MVSKKIAFLCHFALSLLVVGTVLAIVFFVWYPDFYFRVTGATAVLQVLIGVDLVLGPVLTLLLYKPKKPGLLVDIALIVTIQLSALIYGVNVIYQERPYYMVFSVDRFEVLAHKDAVFEDPTDTEKFVKSWGEPLMVVAKIPTDPAEQQRILEETLFQGKPDIHQRPELWSHYADDVDSVFAKARPLSELNGFGPDIAAEIAALSSRYANSEQLVYLPVVARTSVFSLVLDTATRQPVGILDADPWDAPESEPALAQL